MSLDGWIKLHRKFKKWGWYNKSEMVHLFIHLLLSANHQDNEWQGVIIKRGQLVTGRKMLSQETQISEQTIRTCLTNLIKTNEIKRKSTNKYSIITICNYDDYQDREIKFNQQLTSNQPATNQQLTTNKNVKKEKNEKNIYTRKQEFIKQIDREKNSKFSNKLIEKFISYWTELNKSKTLMRFEGQRFFDINKRIATFLSNENRYSKLNDFKQSIPTSIETKKKYIKEDENKCKPKEALKIIKETKKRLKPVDNDDLPF